MMLPNLDRVHTTRQDTLVWINFLSNEPFISSMTNVIKITRSCCQCCTPGRSLNCEAVELIRYNKISKVSLLDINPAF